MTNTLDKTFYEEGIGERRELFGTTKNPSLTKRILKDLIISSAISFFAINTLFPLALLNKDYRKIESEMVQVSNKPFYYNLVIKSGKPIRETIYWASEKLSKN